MRAHLRKTKEAPPVKPPVKTISVTPGERRKVVAKWSKGLDKKYILWIVLVAFIGSAVFFQTFNYNFTQDDPSYTLENSATKRGLQGVPDVLTHGSLNYYVQEPTNTGVYRPLTLLTFCIEYELFHTFDPRVGHAINILLYFLVLVAAGGLLVRLFHMKKVPLPVPLAALLLFALHPLHTEVVASIKGRETLLAALFCLSAMYLWMSSVTNNSRLLRMAATVVFFLGLLSKEEGITFAGVVFLIAYFFYQMNVVRSLKESAPFLVAAVTFLLIRSLVLDPPADTYSSVLNNVLYPLAGPERVATNFYIYLYYIKLLVAPFPLSIDYSFGQVTAKTFANGWVMVSLLFFLFLLYVAYKGFRQRSIIGFGILYYLFTFSIFSNLTESMTIGSTIGERFMFLPSLGFCMLLVYGVYLLSRKWNKKLVPSLLLLLLPVSVLYAAKSFSRTKVWSDSITLFKSGIKTSPRSWRVHNSLAEAARSMATRIAQADSARHTKTDSLQYWRQLAKAEYEAGFGIINELNEVPFESYMHYGDILFSLKDTAGAKAIYQKATTLSSNLSSPWYNLGTIAYYQKDYANAIAYYQRALMAKEANYFLTYKYIGTSYMMTGDYSQAINAYEHALTYESDAEITANLSFLYASAGNVEKAGALASSGTNTDEQRFRGLMNAGLLAFNRGANAEAARYLSQCDAFYERSGGIKAFPDFLNTWGRSLLALNETAKAKALFLRVLKEDPHNFVALQNLGTIAFQHEKNYARATEYFNRCLQANAPDLYFTYSSLGFLYWLQKMPDQAIQSFENALRYGSSRDIINNLYQLWSQKGNQEKMNYYAGLLGRK